MNKLPRELFQYVASYLEPKDFGSLRLSNSGCMDTLEYSLKVRVGPIKKIENPNEEAFSRFVVANSGRYMDRIETLQITQEGMVEASNAMQQDAGDDRERLDYLATSYVQSLERIFSCFPKLRTVILCISDKPDEGDMDMDDEEDEEAPNLGRCLALLTEAIQGYQIKVHLASPRYDVIVFWEGTSQSTTKVRIIGGYDQGSSFRLARIDQWSSGALQKVLNEVRDFLCPRPNAVWFYGWSFEDFDRDHLEWWEELWIGDFLVEPQKLIMEKCYLGNIDDYFEQVVTKKTKLAFENCTLPFETAETLVDMAADPWATPNLEKFHFQRIAKVLFEWEPLRLPGEYDNGERLQEYIAREGLRPAIAHMRRALLTLRRSDSRTRTGFVHEWNKDPKYRQIGYKKKDEWFYANHRKG